MATIKSFSDVVFLDVLTVNAVFNVAEADPLQVLLGGARAVAAVAVDDDFRIFRHARQPLAAWQLRQGDIDGARGVAVGEFLRFSHVDNDSVHARQYTGYAC